MSELEDLKHELEVTDQLLERLQRVMDAIPECPIHGGNCVPHALEWIKKQRENEECISKKEFYNKYPISSNKIEWSDNAEKSRLAVYGHLILFKGELHECNYKQNTKHNMLQKIIKFCKNLF